MYLIAIGAQRVLELIQTSRVVPDFGHHDVVALGDAETNEGRAFFFLSFDCLAALNEHRGFLMDQLRTRWTLELWKFALRVVRIHNHGSQVVRNAIHQSGFTRGGKARDDVCVSLRARIAVFGFRASYPEANLLIVIEARQRAQLANDLIPKPVPISRVPITSIAAILTIAGCFVYYAVDGVFGIPDKTGQRRGLELGSATEL
nr:hypothetical protein [Cupriavidus necator]